MYEIVIFSIGLISGVVLGAAASLCLFRWGMAYATKFIYRIKEDVPLEEIGKPTLQDYSGTEEEK